MVNGYRIVMVGAASMLAMATGCTAASAQSVRQRQANTHDRQQVAEKMEAANRTCGTNVKMTVDWASFSDVKTSPQNPNDQDAWAFVANASDAMDAVCRSGEDGKAVIASDLREIMVRHTSSEQMDYSNGVLRYGVPYQGAGYSKLKDYMLDNIGGGGGGKRGKPNTDEIKSVLDKLKGKLKMPN